MSLFGWVEQRVLVAVDFWGMEMFRSTCQLALTLTFKPFGTGIYILWVG
jgi:hypothetical protein